MPRSLAHRLLSIFAIWTVLSLIGIFAISAGRPLERAASFMVLGIAFLWILVGGRLIFRYRDEVRERVARKPGPRWAWFLGLATAAALIEEAIATLMTNLAPWFGTPLGSVAITASTNYFEVILFHSAVAFIPMFIAWIFLLRVYRFEPLEVMVLFGASGVLVETLHGGFAAVIGMGFWVWVYGLMIYLAAYAANPGNGQERLPKPVEYFYAIVFPIICTLPVALLIQHFFGR